MITKIEHQKTVADKVLSKLELLDRYCIVAGGAPRDWYLGNEATDIDVYLFDSRSTYIYSDQRLGLLNELGLNINTKYENWKRPEMYQSNHHIKHLYNSEIDGEQIQIIFMGKPTFTSVIDTFPISISKIWYKGGEIRTTQDFEDSVKYKVLWKTVDEYKEDNKYLLKIKSKFSDYKYITKEQLQAIKVIKEAVKNLGNDSVLNREEVVHWLLSLGD
jgi:hypothetical protein